jgi:hypothetical protein
VRNEELLRQAQGSHPAALIEVAARLAERRGRVVIPVMPNGRVTEPGKCATCDGPLPIPRRADKLYCSPACKNRRRDNKKS